DRDQHVAHEAVAPGALDRRSGKELAERGIVEEHEIGERRRLQLPACRELRLVAGLRELVPGAHRQAIVAAIYAVADRAAPLARARSCVLDGEGGEAAARIEPVGRRKRRGRADVETGAAAAAVILFRRVRSKLEGGKNRSEEQPRPELARDEIGVLALPADAR